MKLQKDGLRQDLLREIKAFQKEIGYTVNVGFDFYTVVPQSKLYTCYYTGILELPRDYETPPMMKRIAYEKNCAPYAIDELAYDVFSYPMQAMEVVGGSIPITESLLQATDERFIAVIFHEDFHAEFSITPPDAYEASAMIMGMAAAIDFARKHHGEDSSVYQNLKREPEIFLRKSRVIEKYYRALKQIYTDYQNGMVSKDTALQKKEQTFAMLKKECSAIQPAPKTFNRCPIVFNNAGLAFDATYTRKYPAVYHMYLESGKDSKVLFETFKKRFSE